MPACCTTSLASSRLQGGRATFFEAVVGDLDLDFSTLHLAQTPVLIFDLLHMGHHGSIHNAEFCMPLIERCRTDSQLPAHLLYRQTDLNTLQYSHVLAVDKS